MCTWAEAGVECAAIFGSGAVVEQAVVVLFDGVEELDAAGPYEVLAFWTQTHPEDGWGGAAGPGS